MIVSFTTLSLRSYVHTGLICNSFRKKLLHNAEMLFNELQKCWCWTCLWVMDFICFLSKYPPVKHPSLLSFCTFVLRHWHLLDIIRRIVWFNREKCPQQLQPKRWSFPNFSLIFITKSEMDGYVCIGNVIQWINSQVGYTCTLTWCSKSRFRSHFEANDNKV